MEYRSEIDGLRAIAVIPVIFFHTGISVFSGGFVGVDVFFVISGYLITSIILAEMEQGTFSLINFYERRVRRILPALYLVMMVSIPFAWLWLMPIDMKDFSQSLVATSSFLSNILFWRESSYWNNASELKPLLHTWSLAVEEQYYILFPLFLMSTWRFGKRWMLSLLILVAGISLVAAQWGAHNKPIATFYLLPTRGWEFAIGAGVAFYFFYRKRTSRNFLPYKSVDELLGLLGLLMIGYAIFAFDHKIQTPSLYTLVATIGTALIIIFSSSKTIIGRCLSLKPLVAMGLISYSAYLWHYPLLAYAKYTSINQPSVFFLAMIASLSIPLAYLSWRFVEKPFRTHGVIERKNIFNYSLLGFMFFISIGVIGIFTSGFDTRSVNSQLTGELIEEKLSVNYGLNEICQEKFTLSVKCRTDDKPEILIWGDSYAMHLIAGILSSNSKAKIIQMTKSVCGPFFDVAPVNEPRIPLSRGEGCLEFTENVKKWLKENKTVKYAVLSSPFSQYFSGKLLFRNEKILQSSTRLAYEEFDRTLNELKKLGITPIVFSPPPKNGVDLGRCLAKADWNGLNLDICNFAVSEISRSTLHVNNFLHKIAENHIVVFLDDFICSDYECKTHVGNTFLFRDAGHLSHEGSAALGIEFDFYKIIVDQ